MWPSTNNCENALAKGPAKTVHQMGLEPVRQLESSAGIDLAGPRGYRLRKFPTVMICGHGFSTRKRTPGAMESRRSGGS